MPTCMISLGSSWSSKTDKFVQMELSLESQHVPIPGRMVARGSGLIENGIWVFRRREGFGLRTKSLPEEGEVVSRQTTALLTPPADSIE